MNDVHCPWKGPNTIPISLKEINNVRKLLDAAEKNTNLPNYVNVLTRERFPEKGSVVHRDINADSNRSQHTIERVKQIFENGVFLTIWSASSRLQFCCTRFHAILLKSSFYFLTSLEFFKYWIEPIIITIIIWKFLLYARHRPSDDSSETFFGEGTFNNNDLVR